MGNINIKAYSLQEIIDENKKKPHLIIMNNYVYDISDIIYNHPGGSECIIKKCYSLKDTYIDFKFHKLKSKSIWKNKLVGRFIK